MKCQKILYRETKNNPHSYNLAIGYKMSCSVESSPIDEFYEETILTPCDNQKAKMFVNPLHLLLNQQRLNKLGTMGIEQWLQQFRLVKDDSLSELRKKCSDSDLAKMIKSRHLQTPSEILAWSRQMYADMEQFNSELKQLLEAEKKQSEQPTITSEEQVNT